MTTTMDESVSPDRRGAPGDAPPDKASAGLDVHHVVTAAVLIGTAAAGLAFTFGGDTTGPFRISWLDDHWLHLVLLAMTCLCVAEAVGVRLAHDDDGDTVEELNLLEGVVLLSTLLLPIREALLIALVGSLVPYLLRRLDPIKILYNLGVYASASAAAASLMHAIMPVDGRLDARLVLAMFAATTAFVLINLVHIAFLLSAISDTRPTVVLREDARLSVMTIIGTVGMTGIVLVMVVTAPVLLPCAVLPAIALRFGYAASAAKQDERRRSARVLAFSQILASGPDHDVAIESFLATVRQEFGARASLILFDRGTGLIMDASASTTRPYTASVAVQELAGHFELRVVETPRGFGEWSRVMSAPVVVEGERIGTALVVRQGKLQFQPRDLTTFRSLLASLVVALQNAEHRSRREEETSKLRAVVDQAGDGIVVVGRERRIQIWSPAMTRITGISPDVAVGARLMDVIPVADSGAATSNPFAEAEQMLTPETPRVSTDVELVRSDGQRRAARFSHAAAFEAGALARDVIIVRDLTAEWQVERMKSDFIATVSHELRTPLTPIKGYATMLLSRGDTMTPQKRQRALDVIVDRAEHLGRLVEDLLAASTITANGEPKHVLTAGHADLVTLVDRTCEDFPTAAGRLKVTGSPQVVPVLADPTRVVQILSNLLSNALKYSPADRPVHVAVEQRDGQGRVTVTDHGVGIPADHVERIFHKFHRVEDPMVMSTGGTGLGLYIARQLAHAMGGEITVESTLGQGSSFSLTLALDPRAELAV